MREDKLLIISGSRDWIDEHPIRELLGWFDPHWTLVMHGKCPRGADAIADRIAKQMGFTVVRVPADWAHLDLAAGMERNRDMVKIGIRHQILRIAVHAGIFPLPQSKGTKGMHRLCQLAGFDIHMPDYCRGFL
jgi:hypothetical protein